MPFYGVFRYQKIFLTPDSCFSAIFTPRNNVFWKIWTKNFFLKKCKKVPARPGFELATFGANRNRAVILPTRPTAQETCKKVPQEEHAWRSVLSFTTQIHRSQVRIPLASKLFCIYTNVFLGTYIYVFCVILHEKLENDL